MSWRRYAVAPVLAAGLTLLGAGAVRAAAPAAPATPDAAPFKHLGAATCATSACHGKIAAVTDRHVGLNEYRTWQQEDRHSVAFRTLESAQSKAIAAKLGLASATTAKICLDCHSDNVPAAVRGPKFQIRDGVSCEACHGGGEKWIESHAQASTKHADNLARGMYPSEQPLGRARLCLSCHMGTKDRFATHAIMGAGHPRLSFELEAFTTNQPRHYTVDADYKERKGEIAGTNLWVTGQLESARQMVTLLQTPLYAGKGPFPEFAFYDCHGCHHPMKDLRWSQGRAGPGIGPGTLRLHRFSYVPLQALSQAIGTPPVTAALVQATDELLRAGQAGPSAVNGAAARLLAWIEQQEAWSRRTYTEAETRRIRGALLAVAAADRASDYATAEQITLGAESLSYTLNDRAKVKGSLDSLYDALQSDVTFSPGKFADTARAAQGKMP